MNNRRVQLNQTYLEGLFEQRSMIKTAGSGTGKRKSEPLISTRYFHCNNRVRERIRHPKISPLISIETFV